MRKELIIKSKRLAGTSDLTLVAPIKPGLVPSLDTVSYKSRIKRLLQTLGAGRSSAQEYALLRPFSDSVDRVGKIHSFRVLVLEPENKVLLAVTFDGSWESYIRVLWEKVGTLLDIIFFDTEGYVSAYDHRFEEWEAWARRVQVETHFFFGTPFHTVDDVRYLQHEEQCHRAAPGAPADLAATRFAVRRAEDIAWETAAKTSGPASLETLKQGLEGLAALYRLADLYLPSSEDGLFLHRAARELLREFFGLLSADEFPLSVVDGARKRFAKQFAWFEKDSPAPKNPLRAAPPLPDRPCVFDRSDVQAGIVRPYEGTKFGCMLMLAIDDPARAVPFFNFLCRNVRHEDSGDLLDDEVAANVAFTYEGLRAAGLGESELELFPEEFREGMEARASVLGDVRTNHPRRWRLPARFPADASVAEPARIELSAVHLVVQLRVRSASQAVRLKATDKEFLEAQELKEWKSELDAAELAGGVRLLAVQQMQRYFDNGEVKEHFGFADGGSDPTIDPPLHGSVYRNQIHLGELLLGYENEADWPPDAERSKDPAIARRKLEWQKNGSFLVVRKLTQDVEALKSVLAEAESAAAKSGLKISGDEIAEKMMGRRKSGQPLVPSAPGSTNDFDYRDDPQGSKCPFHSHIRRSNPRFGDPLRGEPAGRRTARLARRGMSFGPAPTAAGDGEERGLVFMAYNADIGEQFEVVQRWISGGNASGGFSGQSDPFLGVPETGQRRYFRFEAGDEKVVSVALDGNVDPLGPRRPLVRLDWGMYLFTPSLTALGRLRDALSRRSQGAEPAWSVNDGEAAIQRLLSLEESATKEDAIAAWKEALEDPIEQEKFRSASIWAAIRANHGGVLKCAYGVLVADRVHVMQVLTDDKTYSVCGYRKRLAKSIGEIYLGNDDGEEYRRLCKPVNEAIHKIPRGDAFHLAKRLTQEVIQDEYLAGARRFPNPVDPTRWELILEVKEVIDHVLGRVCQQWFGLPKEDKSGNLVLEGARWDADAHRGAYPGHFTAPSRFVFQPHPGPEAERYGCEYGRTVTAAFTRHLQSIAKEDKPFSKAPDHSVAPVGAEIWKAFGDKGDPDLVARTVVGAMMGFLPTVDGNLRRSLNEWLYDGTFWSVRNAWQAPEVGAKSLADAERIIAPALLRSMQLRPTPELVWRTAQAGAKLGAVDVGAGDVVVASLVSVSQAELESGSKDDYAMFGGDRGAPKHPPHACPGYNAAMGTMLGFIAGLIGIEGSLRAGAIPLALTFEGSLSPPPAPPPPSASPTARGTAVAGGDGTRRESGKTKGKKHAGQVEKQPRELVATEQEAEDPVAREAAERQKRVERLSKILGQSASAVRRAPPVSKMPVASTGPKLVIGLGDSWFHYFAIDLFDALEQNHGYDAVSLAREGRGLISLSEDPDQLLALSARLEQANRELRTPVAILVSAGGNDVVVDQGIDKLSPLLLAYGAGKDLLDAKEVERYVRGDMRAALVKVVKDIARLCEHHLGVKVPIILQGYDYPHPDGRGPFGNELGAWLRPGFEARHYPASEQGLQRATQAMHELIDELNAMQVNVAAKAGGFVHHVKLCGTLTAGDYKQDWGNELHPTPAGFAALARELDKRIQAAIAGGCPGA